MTIRIFNTLTRRKEIFKPFKGKKVRMFVCGPTVYDYSHLGHARTYIAYDIISRYLRFRGFDLTFLMNITDIDDKIINRAKETGRDPLEVAKEFEKKFYEDMKALGINGIDIFARASDHIKEIISQIETLIEKKFAYQTETGVYYDITKFKDYGDLSNQNPEELKKHRIEPDPTKRHEQDFALWKKAKLEEISWDSPWKKGRPGWHIEDTAIAEKILGQQYDIHGGGIDLIFPHHEAEIAQMESVSGKKPMVKYWTHTEFLKIRGEKMAKSLGNFLTIREALEQYPPGVLRLFFAFAHYRSPINYDEKNLEKAKKSLETLKNALENFENLKVGKGDGEFEKRIKELEKEFVEVMDDDFNTAEGLRVLFEIASELNKKKEVSDKVKKSVLKIYKDLLGIFGIKFEREEKIPKEVEELVKDRERARKRLDFKSSDDLRKKISGMGYLVEDTPKGPKVKKK